jgi:TRAP-type C4-dicarboxylate transport system substrate-binding protein
MNGNPMMQRFWQALGIQPEAIPRSEVKAALRAGDIVAI